MKPAQLLRLVRGNLRRNLRTFLTSAFGVSLGIGCLVFFLALGGGLSAAASAMFPAATRELEVVLPQVELGGLLGEARKLDDAAVAGLAAIPGVETAWPKMAFKFPAVTRYNGMFFGRELHMGLELVGVGLPSEAVGENLRLPFTDPGDDFKKPIPVVVNPRLLEIYNKVFAPQRNLPHLTEAMLAGFTFPIELGRSWVAARNLPNITESSLQIAGFSEHATIAGVTLPLAAVRRLNKYFGLDDQGYASVILRARSSAEVTKVAARVKELGLELDESERSRALQIGASVHVATLALTLLAALITLLAAVNIGQAFHAAVRERRRELAVLRAVGATQADVQRLVLAEAAVTGLCGGLTGVLGSITLGLVLDHLARTSLPDFPFKPHSFFAFSAWMPLAGLAVALLATLIGAWLPARDAASADPARALSGD
jgi:putative ABC transport system permease protein